MLSGVDKLHKLYATTAAPVVAARSAGLEVVNELDSLKNVIIGAAGSHAPGDQHADAGGWDYAARAVELASGAVGVVSLLGQVVVSRLAKVIRK